MTRPGVVTLRSYCECSWDVDEDQLLQATAVAGVLPESESEPEPEPKQAQAQASIWHA